MDMVNSNSYWNDRFSNGSWEDFEGNSQSEFFSRLAFDAFPNWLICELTENEWTFIDYGCAEGDGTAYLAKRFPGCTFTGVDFSEKAIEKAHQRYSFCHFSIGNMTSELEPSDIVFSSNTLEHFSDPLPVFRSLIRNAKKHAILLLPLEDDTNQEEHFAIFRAEMFPDNVENHYLSFFKFVDCRNGSSPYWPGKQLLLIYTNCEYASPNLYNLGWIYNKNIAFLMEDSIALQKLNVQYSELMEQHQHHETQLEKCSLLLAQQKAETEQIQRQMSDENAKLTERYSALLAQQKVETEQIQQQMSDENAKLTERYSALLAQQKAETEQIQRQMSDENAKLTERYSALLAQQKAETEQIQRQMSDENVKLTERYSALLAQQKMETEQVMQQLDDVNAKVDELTQNKASLSTRHDTLLLQLEKVKQELGDEVSQSKELTAQLNDCNAILNTIGQLYAETSELMDSAHHMMDEASQSLFHLQHSRAYRIANILIRFKNDFLRGTRQDRKTFLRWIRSGRQEGTLSAYNYPLSMRHSLDSANDLYSKVKHILTELKQDSYKEETQSILACEGISEYAGKLYQAVYEIAAQYSGTYVFVFPGLIDWNIELFQRPQQIAMALSRLGFLFLYGTPNYLDGISVIQEVSSLCFLYREEDCFDVIIQALADAKKQVVLITYSTDNARSLLFYKRYQEKVACILYEYIDEVSEEITGKILKSTLQRHQALIKNSCVKVLATASKLYNDVLDARGTNTNVILSTNGVDYDHFQKKGDVNELPVFMQKLLETGKPIIGYFGALATWFDFELIRYASQQSPEYEFVIIGPAYSDDVKHHIASLASVPNVYFPGAVNYQQLPLVANYFTVATIPFVVNEITESTSPIKLFEYMAMGKTIVTTAMPECRKYPIYVADDYQQYTQMLSEAVKVAAMPEQVEKIKQIALKNSWLAKAAEIVDFCCTKPHYEDVLLFSAIDWDFRFQRPQHLATQFAKLGYGVTYVNVDFGPEQISTYKNGVNILTLAQPSPEIFSTFLLTDEMEDTIKYLLAQIDAHFSSNGIVHAKMIVEYPTWQPIAKRLKEKYGWPICFDYLDEYEGFTGTNSNQLLSKATYWLKQNSDLVIATSQYLYDRIGDIAASKCLVRNGTELEHFASAFNSDRTVIGRPQVGYYGAIADWFDVELVVYVAEKIPDFDFVLIGDHDTVDSSPLIAQKNIKLVGEVPYAELPAYVRSFDVCIIPFKASLKLIKATNPVKFYEYLSAGKKVVSTAIPELLSFKDQCVLMSNDPDEFADNIRRCINGSDGLLSPEECLQVARENTWEKRTMVIHEQLKKINIPKITVIVLTWNNASYNVACIQSIFDKNTYPNLEVIVVDNASTDDTPRRLKEMQILYPQMKVIFNEENLGFATGNNMGIREATGDYIVLLNNDTLVTTGWLEGLLRHFDDPTVGAVGPVTNEIANEAYVPAGYQNLSDIDAFALFRRKKYAGQCFDIKVLALFCTMVPRSVFDKVGLLDESFGIGMFEDDDFSLRIQKEKMRTVCALDVFIHHFGRSGFKLLSNNEYLKIFEENRKIFEGKHNVTFSPHQHE